MRHGVNVCTLGEYADPRLVVDLAGAAEEAGWESLFVWDHLGFTWGVPSGDPWVTLAAVAQATSRLRIGTAVTPLAVAVRRCSPTPSPASTDSAAVGSCWVPVLVASRWSSLPLVNPTTQGFRRNAWMRPWNSSLPCGPVSASITGDGTTPSPA